MRTQRFTAKEMRTILLMKHNGNSYAEIAKEVGRSVKSINMFCQRNRLAQPRTKTAERMVAEGKPVTDVNENLKNMLAGFDVNIDNEIVGTITPLPVHTAPVVTEAPKKEYVQTKTLDDFSSRDMIKKLYDRGYRIEDGKLVCYIKKPVQINEILGK